MVSGRRYCACVGNRGALIGASSAFTLLDFLFPDISILLTAFPCFWVVEKSLSVDFNTDFFPGLLFFSFIDSAYLYITDAFLVDKEE
jgi:hypothetical protein